MLERMEEILWEYANDNPDEFLDVVASGDTSKQLNHPPIKKLLEELLEEYGV